MKTKKILLATLLLFSLSAALQSLAQSPREEFKENIYKSGSNYYAYPGPTQQKLTPAPKGYEPYYISHYGRHGSRYLSNRTGYDTPYRMLCKADSMGELTALGKSVKQQLQQIISDSEGRWGDLSDIGKQQLRHIASRMIEKYPEIFTECQKEKKGSTSILEVLKK
jgi:hypothetical protein